MCIRWKASQDERSNLVLIWLIVVATTEFLFQQPPYHQWPHQHTLFILTVKHMCCSTHPGTLSYSLSCPLSLSCRVNCTLIMSRLCLFSNLSFFELCVILIMQFNLTELRICDWEGDCFLPMKTWKSFENSCKGNLLKAINNIGGNDSHLEFYAWITLPLYLSKKIKTKVSIMLYGYESSPKHETEFKCFFFQSVFLN